MLEDEIIGEISIVLIAVGEWWHNLNKSIFTCRTFECHNANRDKVLGKAGTVTNEAGLGAEAWRAKLYYADCWAIRWWN